jgi:hypothetical protein
MAIAAMLAAVPVRNVRRFMAVASFISLAIISSTALLIF